MGNMSDYDLDFEGGRSITDDNPPGAMANFHTGEHLNHPVECSCVPCTVEARKVHTGTPDCPCKICNPPDWSRDNLLKIRTQARNSYKFALISQSLA